MAALEPTEVLIFDDPDATVRAVKCLREHGITIREVLSPFPVPGLPEEMGLRPTRIGWATFVGGVLGGTLGLGFMVWTHAVGWVLNIGGKGAIALPALVPVTFELTVLGAALATGAALLWTARRRPHGIGRPSLPDAAVMDDRFAVLVASPTDRVAFEACCAQVGPVRVFREGES